MKIDLTPQEINILKRRDREPLTIEFVARKHPRPKNMWGYSFWDKTLMRACVEYNRRPRPSLLRRLLRKFGRRLLNECGIY